MHTAGEGASPVRNVRTDKFYDENLKNRQKYAAKLIHFATLITTTTLHFQSSAISLK